MPSPRNTRDEDPDVAAVVKRLTTSGVKVERANEARQDARAYRRSAAAEAFASGISWRRIAELGHYGTAQAAQQDVTSNPLLNRRRGD
jgi:hypothetical protein